VPITTEPSPHPPPAGVAKLRFRGNYNGASWENVMWCEVSGTPVFADILTLALDSYGAFQTNLLPLSAGNNHLNECIATYYDGVGTIEASETATHDGSESSANWTAAAAMVLSWKVISSYRGGKPRTYLAGHPLDAVDTTRTWTDSHVAAAVTHANAFLTAMNGITTPNISAVALGCVHFFSHGLAKSPPTFDPYIGVGAQKRICSQRRRLGAEIF
jgi:hypothetical protein